MAYKDYSIKVSDTGYELDNDVPDELFGKVYRIDEMFLRVGGIFEFPCNHMPNSGVVCDGESRVHDRIWVFRLSDVTTHDDGAFDLPNNCVMLLSGEVKFIFSEFVGVHVVVYFDIAM